jgi:hypothetical protein
VGFFGWIEGTNYVSSRKRMRVLEIGMRARITNWPTIIPAISGQRADPSMDSPRQSMLGNCIDRTMSGNRSFIKMRMPTDSAVNGMARASVQMIPWKTPVFMILASIILRMT